MAPPVDFHPLAIREARTAHRRYGLVSTALAARFMSEFNTAIARVGVAPKAQTPHVFGTRVCRIKKFLYQIVFSEEPFSILVVAVAHDRWRPGHWRRRLP